MRECGNPLGDQASSLLLFLQHEASEEACCFATFSGPIGQAGPKASRAGCLVIDSAPKIFKRARSFLSEFMAFMRPA